MKKTGWPTVNNHGRSASCAFLLWSWQHFGERPVWGNFGDFCKTRKATLISTLGHTCHAWMSFMPKSRQVPVARDSTQDLHFGQPRHFLRFFPPSSTSTSASELRTSCFVVRSICSAWQSEKVSGTQLKDVERCFRGCSRCWSWSSYQFDAWKNAWNVPDPTTLPCLHRKVLKRSPRICSTSRHIPTSQLENVCQESGRCTKTELWIGKST